MNIKDSIKLLFALVEFVIYLIFPIYALSWFFIGFIKFFHHTMNKIDNALMLGEFPIEIFILYVSIIISMYFWIFKMRGD